MLIRVMFFLFVVVIVNFKNVIFLLVFINNKIKLQVIVIKKKIIYYDMIFDVIEICKIIGLIIFMIINFKGGVCGVRCKQCDLNCIIYYFFLRRIDRIDSG